MQLPAAVTTYFEADKNDQIDALIDAFTERAVVKDEGRTYAGHEAIRSWWRRAKNKYHHVAEPISSEDEWDGLSVRAKVSGDFPTSPAVLKYRFAMAEGKIEKLEIG